jgi:bifunctional DNase/RNase
MVLVEIFGLQIEASSGAPLVLLREVDDPHRLLPIFIGGSEALAIARGLQGVTADRPLTHDLLVQLLERTGNRLEDVAVTDLRDGTFFAELRLEGRSGRRVITSRPSDALALAVRVGAPVYASEAVLDEAGAVLQTADGDEDEEGAAAEVTGPAAEEMVEEFRGFLEHLDPSDFLEGGGEGGSRPGTGEESAPSEPGGRGGPTGDEAPPDPDDRDDPPVS